MLCAETGSLGTSARGVSCIVRLRSTNALQNGRQTAVFVAKLGPQGQFFIVSPMSGFRPRPAKHQGLLGGGRMALIKGNLD